MDEDLDRKKFLDAARRVDRGAKWLDKIKRGWVDEFVKNGMKHGFDISRTNICVLGNVFRDAAGRYSGFFYAEEEYPRLNTVANGFNSGESGLYEEENEEWQYLAEAWQSEVLFRLCKKKDKKFFSSVAGLFRVCYNQKEVDPNEES